MDAQRPALPTNLTNLRAIRGNQKARHGGAARMPESDRAHPIAGEIVT
jgi:hypothetical protein